MLGFDGAACAITTNEFGTAFSTTPFWMSNVQCTGTEDALDDCSFAGWGGISCSHAYNDAGVTCRNCKFNSESPVVNKIMALIEMFLYYPLLLCHAFSLRHWYSIQRHSGQLNHQIYHTIVDSKLVPLLHQICLVISYSRNILTKQYMH